MRLFETEYLYKKASKFEFDERSVALKDNPYVTSLRYYSIAYGGGEYVALGNYYNTSDSSDRTSLISLSNNLSSWTQPTTNPNLDNGLLNCVTYNSNLGQDKFVALGYYGHVSTSSNGNTWTSASQKSDIKNNKIVDCDFMQKPTQEGSVFKGGVFALSENCRIFYGGDSYDSWSSVGTIGSQTETDWVKLTHDDNSCLALSKSGKIGVVSIRLNQTPQYWLTSYTFQALPEDDTIGAWYGLTYANGLYVAISQNGYVAVSADVQNFPEPKKMLSSNYYRCLEFCNGQFIAIGGIGGRNSTGFTIATC